MTNDHGALEAMALNKFAQQRIRTSCGQ